MYPLAPDAQPHQHERHGRYDDQRCRRPKPKAPARSHRLDCTVPVRASRRRPERQLTVPSVGHVRHMHQPPAPRLSEQRPRPCTMNRIRARRTPAAYRARGRSGRETKSVGDLASRPAAASPSSGRWPVIGLATAVPEFQVRSGCRPRYYGWHWSAQHSHGPRMNAASVHAAASRSVGHPLKSGNDPTTGTTRTV